MEKPVRHLKRSSVAEVFGWVGSVSLLSSYAFLSTGLIRSDSLTYNLLCGVGGLTLAIVTFRHRAFQSFTVNVIFTIIALVAIFHILLA